MGSMVDELRKKVPRLRNRIDSRFTIRKKLTRPEFKRMLSERKDKEIRSLAFEVAFYFLFLLLLLLTALHNKDNRSFALKQSVRNSISPKNTVEKIRTTKHLWPWLQTTLIPYCFTNADSVSDNRNVNGSKENINKAKTPIPGYRLGPLRIRQHRSTKGNCFLPPEFVRAQINIRCSPGGQDWTWESGSFCRGWRKPKVKHTSNGPCGTNNYLKGSISPWNYTTWASVGGLPILGELRLYNPGGYIVNLFDSQITSAGILRELEENRWIDTKTKVVLVEFTVYSANTNLFLMVTCLFEFQQTELIQGRLYMHAFRLFPYLDSYRSVHIFRDCLVYLVIAWFFFREVHSFYHERLRYFKHFWNVFKMCNLLLSFAATTLYAGRYYIANAVADDVKKMQEPFFNFQTVAKWDELFGILVAFVCFLSTIQTLHLLRFNRRISLLAATLRHAAGDLLAFAVVFILCLIAFMSFCYRVFGRTLSVYSNMIQTAQSLLRASLGDFDYPSLSHVSPVFAPLFLFLYMMFIVFILINMLLTILNDSFAKVRDDASKQPNDYELIDYIISTTRQVLRSCYPCMIIWNTIKTVGTAPSEVPTKSVQTLAIDSKPDVETGICRKTEGKVKKRDVKRLTANLYSRLDHLQVQMHKLAEYSEKLANETSSLWQTKIESKKSPEMKSKHKSVRFERSQLDVSDPWDLDSDQEAFITKDRSGQISLCHDQTVPSLGVKEEEVCMSRLLSKGSNMLTYTHEENVFFDQIEEEI